MRPPTLLRHLQEAVLRSDLEAYLSFLRSREEQNEEEQSVWRTPEGELPAVVCTSSAALVARQFGGELLSFWVKDNPEAGIQVAADGHDFARVGNFVVDYWLREVEELSPKAVFDLSDPQEAQEARHWLGDPEKWVPSAFKLPSGLLGD